MDLVREHREGMFKAGWTLGTVKGESIIHYAKRQKFLKLIQPKIIDVM